MTNHVAVVGSRTWRDRDFLNNALDALLESEQVDLLVSGGAAGADIMGQQWAESHHIPTRIIYPDWGLYGRSAGFRRNVDIIKLSDLVVAFQIGGSAGTQHSIDLARQDGKRVLVYTERDLR